MTNPSRSASLLATACVALAVLGCGGGSRAVSLSGSWPSEPSGDYLEVTERWTRQGRVRGGLAQHYSEVVDVRATLMSPEWRVAYVEKRAEDEMLPPAKVEALLASHKEAAAEQYEVELLVSTYERTLLDLDKGELSVWRVALRDGRGNEVEASEVVRDRRPRTVINEYFPQLEPFHRPYIARFPRDIEIFGDGAERVELVVSNPKATVKLAWTPAP